MNVDGRALGVDGRIVVDRRAEVGHHPLINVILAVIAQPIGEACSGHGSAETIRLRDRPHGHVAAITPAGDADAIRSIGAVLDGLIHAGQDVAEIAIAEIFDVRARKGSRPAP